MTSEWLASSLVPATTDRRSSWIRRGGGRPFSRGPDIFEPGTPPQIGASMVKCFPPPPMVALSREPPGTIRISPPPVTAATAFDRLLNGHGDVDDLDHFFDLFPSGKSN